MRPGNRFCAGVAALVALVAIGACKRAAPPPAREGTVVVRADELLRDAFTTMLPDFKWANRDVEVTFEFVAAPDVARGAAADVVAVCSEDAAGELARGGKAAAPAVFARDELVLVESNGGTTGEIGAYPMSRTRLRALRDSVTVRPSSGPPHRSACAIAPISNAKHPVSARAWIAFVQSSTGQQILRDAGFLPP